MTTRRVACIGDLHLEGRLQQYIPDYDGFVLGELKRAIKFALDKGYWTVALLGDLCDHYSMSTETYERFLGVLNLFPEVEWLVLRGNHDVDSKHASEDQKDSLKLLRYMANAKMLKRMKVATNKPITLFPDDAPIRLLPWPFTNTKAGMLNLAHTDCAGSQMDNGRASESEWVTDHVVVSGHLHTKQVVRNTYFPGTLHQTYFGEGHDKYVLLVDWTGKRKTSKFEFHNWHPRYTLRTSVINTMSEYERLCSTFRKSDGKTLYRVVVNSRDVLLPAGAFDAYPCVVKTNPFRTQEELKSVMVDELNLDADQMESGDLNVALNEWLRMRDVDAATVDRALHKLNQLLESTP